LYLPVNTAKRLSNVSVERALVVSENGLLPNQKIQLRVHQPVVDQISRRERRLSNACETRLHLAIELHFGIDRCRPEVAQSSIRIRKLRAVPVTTDVSGRDRVPLKMKEEVPVAQSWKITCRQWSYIDWRRRCRASLDIPQNSKRSRCDRCFLKK